MLQTCARLLFLASTFTYSIAAVFERFADLPAGLDYDYIIIGGGTAGNVIANRLTENPQISVLVLEAGGSNENVLDSMVPFFCTHLTPNTPYDWNYTTAPQAALNGRSVPYARGFMLGGSSSVTDNHISLILLLNIVNTGKLGLSDFLAYTRGSSEDFDRYARISGDSGWSWDNLQHYIRKNERFSPPADFHNTTGQFDPAVHAFNGVTGVSLPGFQQAIDERVIQATSELSEEFPFNLDQNSGNHIGIGWQQGTIRSGMRSSSATSYLAQKYIRRPNLHVLLQTQVARVLQTPPLSDSQHLSLRTVEFSQSAGKKREKLTASKEVILSAGSIGTPHILLNSGIGDSQALNAIGIKPILDLPSVGKNLSDHPVMGNTWLINGTDTFETASRNASLAAEQLHLWETTRTGPLVDTTFNQIGWLRLPDNATIFKTFSDPAAGPHTAHFELIFSNGIRGTPPQPTGNYMSITTVVVSPSSRGSVSINSSNPFDPPVINPNLLASPFDMFVMREAVRSARRFLKAPVWADYIIVPLNNSTTDAELDQDIRAKAASIFHPVGTAAMSAKNSGYGVVDPDLRVKGVTGLRIVDASVFPMIPTAHTQAAVYIFAERAAELVKLTW